MRELMAVMGVAAGVALLFTVQVANRSITGSFDQMVRSLAGRATLEVSARSPEGFNESVAEQVAQTPGVQASAPILEARAVISHNAASRPVTLVGADERVVSLESKFVARFASYGERSRQGLLVLTEPIAHALKAKPTTDVSLQVAGETRHLTVAGAVPSGEVGPLADSPIAAVPLPILQHLASAPDRVTRILVEPHSGEEQTALVALEQRFGATLNVRPISREGQLLADAARPEGQLTALFSLIAVLVGMILAYNSLLLASGERRKFIAYLTQLGTKDSAIVTSLAFDALIMGLAGCAIGLLIGDAISLLAYRAVPGYLAAAFPIGSQRIIGAQTILSAIGAGMLAAFMAAALPAIGVLRATSSDPSAARWLSFASKPRGADTAVFLIGAALITTALVLALSAPAISVIGLIGLVVGLVLITPFSVRYLLRFARAASRRSNDPTARLSTAELGNSPTRSVALVATGMIAVFLMVTIGGSVADVKRAVRAGAGDTLSNAQLWVRTGGASNVYDTEPFPAGEAERALDQLSVVRSVAAYQESFLDLPTRRLWVIGVPAHIPNPIAASQLIEGSANAAASRLREPGWFVMSKTVASEHHLRLGERFALPTPSGSASLRLAATISNYGWLPGTVLLSTTEYSRLWDTHRASQLAVTLAPGVSLAEGKLAIQRGLPTNSALTVQTAEERQAQISSVLGSTLGRLQQTSTVVLIVAIMTVVAMMISAVWQRRGRLDALISIGMSSVQLARLVFYESGCVLLGGCLTGMIAGLLGQHLVDTWLQHTTGSPIQFDAAWQLGLRTILIASIVSVVTATLAVMRTVRFQPTTAFSTE